MCDVNRASQHPEYKTADLRYEQRSESLLKETACVGEPKHSREIMFTFWPVSQWQKRSRLLSRVREMRRKTEDTQKQNSAALSTFRLRNLGVSFFRNPFAIDVDGAPEHLQLELIELQCNGALEAKFDFVGAGEFAPFIPNAMPQFCLLAARLLSPYSGEQMFSVMEDQIVLSQIPPHRQNIWPPFLKRLQLRTSRQELITLHQRKDIRCLVAGNGLICVVKIACQRLCVIFWSVR